MTELWVAQAGINQLHARFVDAVWRQDREVIADCVTEDVDWKIAGMQLRGREEASGTLTKLLNACKRIRLIVGTPVLDVGDGVASGRVPVTEFTQMADGSPVLTIGVYYDRYEQQGDVWRFKTRHFGLHYRGPMDLSGEFIMDSSDFGAPPNMPAPDAPTLTRRKQD